MGFRFSAKEVREKPDSDHKRFQSAESLINYLRAYDIGDFPIDLVEVYRLVGPKLKLIPMPNDISGKLEKQGEQWVAFINALHSESRQRFTMAHELGHYLLHVNKSNDESFIDRTFFRKEANTGSKSSYEIKEFEANKFAAELLMPKNEFVTYIREKSNKVSEISSYFNVSPIAVKVRAENIKNKYAS